MWNTCIRTLWPLGYPLTSSSLCKTLLSQTRLFCPTSPGRAHQTLHCYDPQVITANHLHEGLVHAPLPMEYLSFSVRGKLSQMVVKGTKNFPKARCLNSTTPFPTPCTFRITPSYQFAKYLQQFNKLQAEWSVCKKN
ncbi:hypothetical protein TNCV_4969831 [Trichonephila clavipes]|nr:hypothetical protein TNCV_4969831 [Trichonephila clavipes]